jgi:polyphosphate kinase
VGRFLEHSRIFYFANGGEPDIYLGSADWMPRNLYERVEVMFPVKDSSLRHRIFDQILQTYLRDDDKTRILRSDGSYGRVVQANSSRPSRNGTRFSAQRFFVGVAEGKSEIESTVNELQSQRTPNVLPAAS